MPNKLDETLRRRLKYLYLMATRIVQSARTLPDFIVTNVEQRRLQTARNAAEAERLDRIRNPSKYLGKS
jgi:hypothetical protein